MSKHDEANVKLERQEIRGLMLLFENKDLEKRWNQDNSSRTRNITMRYLLASAAFQGILYWSDALESRASALLTQGLFVKAMVRLALGAFCLLLCFMVGLRIHHPTQVHLLLVNMIYAITTMFLFYSSRAAYSHWDSLFLIYGLAFFMLPKMSALKFSYATSGGIALAAAFIYASAFHLDFWDWMLSNVLVIAIFSLMTYVSYSSERASRERWLLKERLKRENISLKLVAGSIQDDLRRAANEERIRSNLRRLEIMNVSRGLHDGLQGGISLARNSFNSWAVRGGGLMTAPSMFISTTAASSSSSSSSSSTLSSDDIKKNLVLFFKGLAAWAVVVIMSYTFDMVSHSSSLKYTSSGSGSALDLSNEFAKFAAVGGEPSGGTGSNDIDGLGLGVGSGEVNNNAAFALLMHTFGFSVFLLYFTGQIRWLVINGLVALALMWGFNMSGIERKWVIFGTHTVGYVILVVVIVVMVLVFGGVVLVWSNLIEFLKDIMNRYPQVKCELRENKLLEQVIVSVLSQQPDPSYSTNSSPDFEEYTLDTDHRTGINSNNDLGLDLRREFPVPSGKTRLEVITGVKGDEESGGAALRRRSDWSISAERLLHHQQQQQQLTAGEDIDAFILDNIADSNTRMHDGSKPPRASKRNHAHRQKSQGQGAVAHSQLRNATGQPGDAGTGVSISSAYQKHSLIASVSGPPVPIFHALTAAALSDEESAEPAECFLCKKRVSEYLLPVCADWAILRADQQPITAAAANAAAASHNGINKACKCTSLANLILEREKVYQDFILATNEITSLRSSLTQCEDYRSTAESTIHNLRSTQRNLENALLAAKIKVEEAAVKAKVCVLQQNLHGKSAVEAETETETETQQRFRVNGVCPKRTDLQKAEDANKSTETDSRLGSGALISKNSDGVPRSRARSTDSGENTAPAANATPGKAPTPPKGWQLQPDRSGDSASSVMVDADKQKEIKERDRDFRKFTFSAPASHGELTLDAGRARAASTSTPTRTVRASSASLLRNENMSSFSTGGFGEGFSLVAESDARYRAPLSSALATGAAATAAAAGAVVLDKNGVDISLRSARRNANNPNNPNYNPGLTLATAPSKRGTSTSASARAHLDNLLSELTDRPDPDFTSSGSSNPAHTNTANFFSSGINSGGIMGLGADPDRSRSRGTDADADADVADMYLNQGEDLELELDTLMAHALGD